MAKESAKQKNKKILKLISQNASKRASLKAKMNDRNLDPKERFEAMTALSEMPRNSSRVRHRNRCALTGRPRAYHGFLGICRVEIRRLAALGLIPGLKKSSW